MFDRCDTDTRSIIDAALDESRRRGHTWLGTEHVLLALAQRRDLLGPEVAAILPDAGVVATALDADLDGPPGRVARRGRRYVAPSARARSRISAAGASTSRGTRGGDRGEGACRSSPGP